MGQRLRRHGPARVVAHTRHRARRDRVDGDVAQPSRGGEETAWLGLGLGLGLSLVKLRVRTRARVRARVRVRVRAMARARARARFRTGRSPCSSA